MNSGIRLALKRPTSSTWKYVVLAEKIKLYTDLLHLLYLTIILQLSRERSPQTPVICSQIQAIPPMSRVEGTVLN